MGGVVIIASTVLGYFLAELITQTEPSASALLLLFLFVGMGVVGFLDDFIKISKQRSLGLRSKAKMVGQTVIALVFGWLALSRHARGRPRRDARPPDHLSFIRDSDVRAADAASRSLLFWVMITGTSNAVNLTDGLDGLATGACAMVFGAYMLVNIWQNNQSCATRPGPACYEVRDPLDLALVAAAITGACFGFLWWNAPPAQIFMGDTGSLSLGGALAGFAIMTRTELLLVDPRRPVPRDHPVGDAAGRLLQAVATIRRRPHGVPGRPGPPGVPDGAAPAPLRAARLGPGHDRDPLLDHHRALRRGRARHLLRRLGRRAHEPSRVDALGRRDDWSGVRAVVAGFGVSGFAAADNLTHLGASVVALDESRRRQGGEGRAARGARRRHPARRRHDRRRCPTTSTCSSSRPAGSRPRP